MVPPEEAFNIPASVNAAVPVPAGKVATYIIVLPEAVVLVKVTRADSEPNAVSPAAAAVESVPVYGLLSGFFSASNEFDIAYAIY